MKRTLGIVGSGTIAALIALGSFAGLASAQTPTGQTPPQSPPGTDPHPIRIQGVVQGVGSNDVQLRTRRGPLDVNVSNRTWILIQRNDRCVEGTLADIQAQEPAAVAGMTTGQPGEVDARVLVQGRRCLAHALQGRERVNNRVDRAKAFIVRHAAVGTIKSISGGTLTLTTERGVDATINTTAETVVLNNGFVSVGTLKVGDRVSVLGAPVRPSGENKRVTPGRGVPGAPVRAIDAWGIRVVSDGTQLMGGRVGSISGNTITLAGPRKEGGLTVNVDGSTGYRSASVADRKITLSSAALADVKVGSVLVVDGTKSADGKSVQAKAVIIMPAKQRGNE